MRHGYRGAEGKIPLEQLTGPRVLADLMANMSPVSHLLPGIVTSVNEDVALVTLANETFNLILKVYFGRVLIKQKIALVLSRKR